MEGIHPLKTYRSENRLSQAKLARLLEVARTTVARWESGDRDIDKRLVPQISRKTGIPAQRLRPDLAALFTVGEAA